MKTKTLKLMMVALGVLLSINANAYDVEVNGIFYNLVTKAKQAEVTSGDSKYTGKVVIPESFSYDGVTYSVTSIGNSAFYKCSDLTSLTIPNSVTSIGWYAFSGCSGLTSMTIPESVTSIGDGAFMDCSGLTSVTINSNEIVSKSYAWYAGDNSYAWENSIKNLFGNQVQEYILGGDVTSIGNSAFYGCSGLTSVTIPNSVTSIGEGTFSGCSGLTSVTIPNSVTSIGKDAFDGCSGLVSVTIPGSVMSIGCRAFDYCRNLTTVRIEDCEESLSFDTRIRGNLGYTDMEIFRNCALKEVYIGRDISYTGCSPFNDSSFSVHSIVTFGDHLTKISHQALRNCSNLATINIPKNVTYITGYAFHGTAWYNNQPDGLIYLGKVLYGYKGDMPQNTKVDVKNGTINISSAFYGCSGLTSVTIPNSVTSIGSSAFEGCSGLTSVTIPNSVTSIGRQAFYGCSSLTFVAIPESVTSIGESAFYGCRSLTSVTIPESVTNIGYGTFHSCSGLTSVTIPNSVTSIGESAFYSCSSLTSVIIPSSVTYIGEDAFRSCSGLTSATINATTIGEGVFRSCGNLEEIHLGVNVTNIGKEAFLYCSELTDVYCYATKVPGAASDIFKNCYIDYQTLHVPESALGKYKAREPWNQFGNIVPLTERETDIKQIDADADASISKIFTLDGKPIDTFQKGVNIIRSGKEVKKVFVK